MLHVPRLKMPPHALARAPAITCTSPARSHAYPLAYPRAYPRTRPLIRSLTRAPMRALARSPARSLARLCAHPPAHLRRMHAHLRAQDVATTWPNPTAYVLNLDNIYIYSILKHYPFNTYLIFSDPPKSLVNFWRCSVEGSTYPAASLPQRNIAMA